MELFKEPLEHLSAYLQDAGGRKVLREFYSDPFSAWPEQSSLVLQEDTALELGGAGGSLFMILWTGQGGVIRPGRISLVGPDLVETAANKLPFTQIVLVRGAFQDEYATYRDLRDTVFDTRLKGISTRVWPDRQKVWCRVSREALGQGFNLMRYGCTLLKRLYSLPSVQEAEIIFATEALNKGPLTAVAEKVQDMVEALLMIYEENDFDCESCEYSEICEEVAGLKEIHQRLQKEREQP
jgi:CO dehydrogenase/acetyl-CoA synthase beta subunit